MRFCSSIFATLLKPLDRRRFKAIVAPPLAGRGSG
jgi:hypothetical protein